LVLYRGYLVLYGAFWYYIGAVWYYIADVWYYIGAVWYYIGDAWYYIGAIWYYIGLKFSAQTVSLLGESEKEFVLDTLRRLIGVFGVFGESLKSSRTDFPNKE